jgi:hypothetical protein
MKNITFQFLTIALILSVLFVGCKKDKKEESKVQENGLTQEINNLIPDSIITAMVNLGMPINRGETPPDISASFLASPFILKSSTILSDVPGYQFSDYTVTFYEQNNDNLSVRVDYLNGPESGTGLGGFIVGANNNFSVFAEVNSTYSGKDATLVHVISGTLTATGIQNLYFANFMLNNNGNPGGIWIEEGDGRVIYDSDGFSEKVTKASFENHGNISNAGASLVIK